LDIVSEIRWLNKKMFKITIDHADHTGIIGELMKPILKRGGTMREFGCIDKRGILKLLFMR
jgi:hypothetical protein